MPKHVYTIDSSTQKHWQEERKSDFFFLVLIFKRLLALGTTPYQCSYVQITSYGRQAISCEEGDNIDDRKGPLQRVRPRN